MSGTCPHSIIYSLKFVLRAESPRDYIDILLSMAHKPNIVIIDMANMLVAHSKNRTKGMFHPNDGMVAEPTEENIKLANEGKNFPGLKEKSQKMSKRIPILSLEVHSICASSIAFTRRMLKRKSRS